MTETLLAIDNGTQSVRAMLFDLNGNLVAKSQVMLTPYFSSEPGWAEQHPNYFWENVCKACQLLWQQPGAKKDSIKGMSVTTQRGTVINVDESGHALRPAILWLDQRRVSHTPTIHQFWRLLFYLANVSDTVHYFQTEAEANWIKLHQPEIWQKTYKYLLLSGYLNFKLTGLFKDSIGAQVGFLPFDYKRHAWAKSYDWKWQGVAIEENMLPELVAPCDLIGTVTQDAHNDTGIPTGLPVFAAGSDKACEVLGAGCLTENIGCLSYGTTATINVTSKKYIEPVTFIPPYPAAIPQHYSTEVQIYRGYWMVSWFKKQFGHKEREEAKKLDATPEALFDELVNQVPPGSMGLMLQPYWSPGVRTPGPEAKGAIIGFGDVHTRAHLYRSILEGLAYALREGSEKIQKRSGIMLEALRISGGGSQSDAAMQLTSDIFGLPTQRPHIYETSGLGAAIDTAIALKYYESPQDAINNMTRIKETFEPNHKHHRTYNDLYQQVYKKMYSRLKPLYASIKEITGYPS